MKGVKVKDENFSIKTAYKLEAEYIEKFKDYKYIPSVNFEGSTECFSKNIINEL